VCCNAIVEASGGTAAARIEARYSVRLNGATVAEDSLVRQLSASRYVAFPAGVGNTVLLPSRHVGDEITISARFRMEATSTGSGDVQLYTCSAFVPARLVVEVSLLDISTAVAEAAPRVRLLLRGAFPNPFNPGTTIRYSTPLAGPVRLTVHDVRGRWVATLVDRMLPPGEGSVFWDGRDASGLRVSSGVYVARLLAGEAMQSQTLVLAK
jgi:hypothetical protein